MIKQQQHAAIFERQKVLFVADNRNRENWGCRATSIALKEIINSHSEIAYTIYGDITGSYNPELIHGYSKWMRLYKLLYNAFPIFRRVFKLFDVADIISSTVKKSLKRYRKAIKVNKFIKDLDKQIKEVDAIVVNGEGTFIFSTPNRYDTIFYLLILKVAQDYGKRTYLLNAMYSDSPTSKRNISLLSETRQILEKCTMVTARDPLSYDYCKAYIVKSVKYVPDALFTWNKYFQYNNLCMNFPYATISFPEMENKWINYNKPYLCLSGSSLAAGNPRDAFSAFYDLALLLNEKVLPTIIVSTCSGDSFLEPVAKKAGLPYVSVQTNILSGMSILGNASVFVSGRWHPSILASISGTPCVFLGSNSHKTLAIQVMLGYKEAKEYSAIPNSQEISCIVQDAIQAVEKEHSLRKCVTKKIEELSIKAINGNNIASST